MGNSTGVMTPRSRANSDMALHSPRVAHPHSKERHTRSRANSETALTKLLMPPYFTTESVSREESSLAQAVWNDVLNNTAPRYRLQKESFDDFAETYPSALDYFSYTFFVRLFDIHPACRFVLSKVSDRNKFIKIIVAFLINDFWEDERATKVSVEYFVRTHHDRGVRTVEYGVIGDTLFYAFRQVLGIMSFSPDIQHIWTKVYSRFLSVIVPLSIHLELEDKKKQQNQAQVHAHMTREQYAYYHNMYVSSKSSSQDAQQSSGCPHLKASLQPSSCSTPRGAKSEEEDKKEEECKGVSVVKTVYVHHYDC